MKPDQKLQGLPVAGYRSQDPVRVELVNANKQSEESILRVLDALAEIEAIDKRWLSIGRTHIEQGFMAINRSIFRPDRVDLSEDITGKE